MKQSACLALALALFLQNAAIPVVFADDAMNGPSASEHASHHGGGPSSQPSGGMMEEMGKMMQSMGAPPRKEFYPSMMGLPALSREETVSLDEQALDRMHQGLTRMHEGLQSFEHAMNGQNLRVMHESLGGVREGLDSLESGVATRRMLQEGIPPENIALSWFRKQVNLGSPLPETQPMLGLSVFHWFVMILLVTFSTSMIVLYFLKMRRASDLLSRLTTPGTPSDSGEGGGMGTPQAPTTPVSNGRTTLAGINRMAEAPRPPTAAASMWSGKLRVSDIRIETPSVKTFRLCVPEGGRIPFSFLPGQFVTLSLAVDGKHYIRSYSIASSPSEQNFFELTIKRQEGGAVSPYLHDVIRVGDLLNVTGPSGRFTFIGDESNSIVLIGGGVGITPLMSVARAMTDSVWQGSVDLLVNFHSEEEIIFRGKLRELEKRNPLLKVHIVLSHPTDPSWDGLRGRLSKEIILRCVPDIASRRIHLCGPAGMMDSVRSILAELGVAASSIKTESFGALRVHEPAVPFGRAAGENIVSAQTTVSFVKSNKRAFLTPDLSVLEAAESVGVPLDYACRAGTCGICKIKLLSGRVSMAVDEGLTEDDKQMGLILACQAKATENISVEA